MSVEVFSDEFKLSYGAPWPLTTKERVAWANRVYPTAAREWRLGDTCSVRPAVINLDVSGDRVPTPSERAAAEAKRDAALLRFTLLSLAIQGYQHVSFEQAMRWSGEGEYPTYLSDEEHWRRVTHVQNKMRQEHQRLIQELWP